MYCALPDRVWLVYWAKTAPPLLLAVSPSPVGVNGHNSPERQASQEPIAN